MRRELPAKQERYSSRLARLQAIIEGDDPLSSVDELLQLADDLDSDIAAGRVSTEEARAILKRSRELLRDADRFSR